MSQLSKIASRTVLMVTAAATVLFAAAQGAQAAQRQPDPVAATSSVAATSAHFQYGHDWYTLSQADDGGLAFSKVAADSQGNVIAPQATWSVRMSRSQTLNFYWGAVGGAGGTVVAICKALMPNVADVACDILLPAIMAYVANMAAPGPNKCFGFSISTRLALPPWKFSIGYVTC